MSLTLCVTTPDGIVLAADSRQSYRNPAGAGRINSDTATKLFNCGEHIGITVTGPAIIVDQTDPSKAARGIGSYINDFVAQFKGKQTVGNVAEKLRKYLLEVFKPELELANLEQGVRAEIAKMGGQILSKKEWPNGQGLTINFKDKSGKPATAQAGIAPLTLTIAGYDEDEKEGSKMSVYLVEIPGETTHRRQHGTSEQYGATWTGQTDVVQRIIKGTDPKIGALPFIEPAVKQIGDEEVRNQLNGLEYRINWAAMTLFDAVAFVTLMIKTTEAIQKFSDGTLMSPGDIPGVGGDVDVAVIKPGEGFFWHKRKELGLVKP